MRCFSSFFLLFCLNFPAFADENTPDFNVLCQYLHKEKPVIGIRSVATADYVPGVDIHGNKVASSDVDGSQKSFLSTPIIIPVQLDLLNRAGVAVPAGLFSDAIVGDIKIYDDGTFVFGEEDISSQVESFCDNPIEEHRQKEPNPLPSSDKIEGQFP